MRNSISKTLGAAATLGLLALSGCNFEDPLKRPYMWHESEANPQNIRAMAANPADLTHGRDSPRHRVALESDGVDRLWNGKPLPFLGASGGSGGGGAAPAAGGS